MRVLKWLLDTVRGTDAGADTYADVDTMFGRTLVYDTHDAAGDVIRVLDVAGTWQSASYVGRRWADLAFGYHRVFDDVIFGSGAPARTRMLMLGGGALSYPKHVVATRPDVQVDVVEVDPTITELARRYFFVDRLGSLASRRLRVTHADGAAYLADAARSRATYDVIVNDAFAAFDAPRSLADERAVAHMRRLLSPRGLYVANVVSAIAGDGPTALDRVMRTLAGAFAHVQAVPLGADEPTVPDNNVVIATDDDARILAGALTANELRA